MKFKIFFLSFGFLFLHSCQKDDTDSGQQNEPTENKVSNFDSELISTWTEVYLKIEKDLPGFRPSATCRAIGYINLAAYETALPGMKGYKSNAEYLPELNLPKPRFQINDINWNVALNACYSATLNHFLLNKTSDHQALLFKTDQDMNARLKGQVFSDVYFNSITWGNSIADAVIKYANSDLEGYEQSRNPFPSNYVPPVGEGKWVPTAPDFTKALFPYWGKTRTFIAKAEDLIALKPIEYSTSPSSEYYKQHKSLNDIVKNLSYEDRSIAEFWSDDIVGLTYSPPARLLSLANQMLHLEKMNLEDGLYFYCKLGMAINDAAVVTWNSKYIYNTERPETFIKKYINPDFESILGEAIGKKGLEPPFPGYPSGHSTFAGVQAEIFTAFFGKKYPFTDHSHEGRVEFISTPRSYNTWDEMAAENAYSRIPLGVHIKMDCDEGLRLGSLIGKRVISHDLKK
ncbi:MAG: vanadium-dependent haloperoxidase [Saprospiraceae bacterium]|nr:vanadium-dependent haloperoxidase [Saprospiraceae bacterium]